jgi:hypothetical protein
MSRNWRERRRAELNAAQSGLELLKVLLLYRDAVGLDLYQQLPSNLSFRDMIEAIIDHEADAVRQAEAA